MQNLVIVESKTKETIIEKYLNACNELKHLGSFKVIACLGHVQDLPQKELGIDTNTWNMTFIPIAKKKELLGKIKLEAKKANKIYLATDLDMEGNAIANHLRYLLKLSRDKYERVVFHEITKEALKYAFLNPVDINMNMVYAQETRRILDRLVGYELSPLLWRRFPRSSKTQPTLSAGRVQSATLKIIVDNTTQFKNHIPIQYWKCNGKFLLELDKDITLDTTAYLKTQKQYIASWNSQEDTLEFIKILSKQKNNWKVSWISKNVNKNPPAPFTTSTLQQEAYKRYHFSAKTTMQLAQSLYESGFITYMRTDSVNLSKESQTSIIEYISDSLKDVPQPRKYTNKSTNAQEAHEAIRPTNITNLTVINSGNNKLSEIHNKLYTLIWKRTVASQMKPAVYNELHYDITHPEISDYLFHGKKSVLIEEGYLKVYTSNQEQLQSKDHISFNYNDYDSVIHSEFLMKADIIRPEALYDESGIVKILEKEGIGRPSTYATIIDKLFDRKYIESFKSENIDNVKDIQVTDYKISMISDSALVSNPKIIELDSILKSGIIEKNKIISTALGEKVVEYLLTVDSSLLDTDFTKIMEDNLDKICDNKNDKISVLNDFYKNFNISVNDAKDNFKTKDKDKTDTNVATNLKILSEYPKQKSMIVETKYGPAIFYKKTTKSKGTFYSIAPLIEWRKYKDYTELTEHDISLVISLPKKIEDSDMKICLGRYGFYLQKGKKNCRLKEDLWKKIYDGSLSKNDID